MNELADVAGIISGEDHMIRDVLWLPRPSLPSHRMSASFLPYVIGGPHGGSPYPFLSDLSSLG